MGIWWCVKYTINEHFEAPTKNDATTGHTQEGKEAGTGEGSEMNRTGMETF